MRRLQPQRRERIRPVKRKTRTWCKGVEGVRHVWAWVEDEKHWSHILTRGVRREDLPVWSVQKCKSCGKRGGGLAWYFSDAPWDPVTKRYPPLYGPAFGGADHWVRE